MYYKYIHVSRRVTDASAGGRPRDDEGVPLPRRPSQGRQDRAGQPPLVLERLRGRHHQVQAPDPHI